MSLTELPRPLVILLAGSYGVGKTTVAHELACALNVPQRVSLSGITKTIKVLAPHSEVARSWKDYDRSDPVAVRAKLRAEAGVIGPVITSLVESAEKYGKNCIIDGVQLVPAFLPMGRLLFFRLTVADELEHRRRYEHPSVTKVRRDSRNSFDLARIVDAVLKDECSAFDVPVIDTSDGPCSAAAAVVSWIRCRYPDCEQRFLWFGHPTNESRPDHPVAPPPPDRRRARS